MRKLISDGIATGRMSHPKPTAFVSLILDKVANPA
jgi:hypothetical protein